MINQWWSLQVWDVIFRRALNDWEIESFYRMLQLLGSFGGTSDCHDRLRWKMNNKGIFIK